VDFMDVTEEGETIIQNVPILLHAVSSFPLGTDAHEPITASEPKDTL